MRETCSTTCSFKTGCRSDCIKVIKTKFTKVNQGAAAGTKARRVAAHDDSTDSGRGGREKIQQKGGEEENNDRQEELNKKGKR